MCPVRGRRRYTMFFRIEISTHRDELRHWSKPAWIEWLNNRITAIEKIGRLGDLLVDIGQVYAKYEKAAIEAAEKHQQ